MLVTVVLVVTAVVTAVWAYSRYRHNYWTARGVPTAPRLYPLLGHSFHLLSPKNPRWLFLDEAYRLFGGSRMFGVYEMHKPVLVIGDPDLMKVVLIKDFDHFVDRRTVNLSAKRDKIFSGILTMLTGEEWKGVRSVLSPLFTSGKMKGLYHLVDQKADQLLAYIRRGMKSDSSVRIRKAFGCYTLEVISSCAFGLETNTLVDGDSLFNQKVQTMSKISPSRFIRLMLFILFPKVFEILKIPVSIQETEFFNDVVIEAIKKRKDEKIKRGDFLDLMLEARGELENSASKTHKNLLTDDMVVSNAILFILAGFDTTANTLSFTSFLLAGYPEEQQRLRQELRKIVKEHGALTYQAIMDSNLLEAVISESLRLHPIAHFLERKCTKDYTVPGTNVTVKKEDMISIPVWSLHYDEKYWSDPKEFRPDRFLPENKDQIRSGTYLPFGLGPRNCIGMRFALMEAKLALAKLVLNFELSRAPGSEEMKYDALLGIMKPSDDIKLIFTPLE